MERSTLQKTNMSAKPPIPIKPKFLTQNNQLKNNNFIFDNKQPCIALERTSKNLEDDLEVFRVVPMYNGPIIKGAEKSEIEVKVRRAYRDDSLTRDTASDISKVITPDANISSHQENIENTMEREFLATNIVRNSNSESNMDKIHENNSIISQVPHGVSADTNQKNAKNTMEKVSQASNISITRNNKPGSSIASEEEAVNYIVSRYSTLEKISCVKVENHSAKRENKVNFDALKRNLELKLKPHTEGKRADENENVILRRHLKNKRLDRGSVLDGTSANLPLTNPPPSEKTSSDVMEMITDFTNNTEGSAVENPNPFHLERPSSPDSGISSMSYQSQLSAISSHSKYKMIFETDFPAVPESQSLTLPYSADRLYLRKSVLPSPLLPMEPLFPTIATSLASRNQTQYENLGINQENKSRKASCKYENCISDSIIQYCEQSEYLEPLETRNKTFAKNYDDLQLRSTNIFLDRNENIGNKNRQSVQFLEHSKTEETEFPYYTEIDERIILQRSTNFGETDYENSDRKSRSLGRNVSLLRSFAESNNILDNCMNSLKKDGSQCCIKSSMNRGVRHSMFEEDIQASQQQKKSFLRQKNENQKNEEYFGRLRKTDKTNTLSGSVDGIDKSNHTYEDITEGLKSKNNHSRGSSKDSVNSVTEKLRKLCRSNDLVNQISADCVGDGDQAVTKLIYSMQDYMKSSFNHDSRHSRRSLRDGAKSVQKFDKNVNNNNEETQNFSTSSTSEFPVGSCQTLPSRGKKSLRSTSKPRTSAGSQELGQKLSTQSTNFNCKDRKTEKRRENSTLDTSRNFTKSQEQLVSSEEAQGLDKLSEQEISQIEMFYKGQGTQVLACRCLADLYFTSARRHSASSASNLVQHRKPLFSDQDRSADSTLEAWIRSCRGLPLLVLDSGASRRDRRLTLVVAERGTGFTLWRDEITNLTNYRPLSPSLHTLQLSRDPTRMARLNFLNPVEALRFHQALVNMISESTNDMGASRKSRISWLVKSRPPKWRPPSKADISNPCCFVHVTNLSNMDDVAAFQNLS